MHKIGNSGRTGAAIVVSRVCTFLDAYKYAIINLLLILNELDTTQCGKLESETILIFSTEYSCLDLRANLELTNTGTIVISKYVTKSIR